LKAYFVPTIREGRAIFPGAQFRPWKFNIEKCEYNGILLFSIGVSKTSAAFSATVILSSFDISEAVLTGICGAYRGSGLSVGDVITISKDWFIDEGLFMDGRVELLHEMGFGFTAGGYSEFKPYSGLPIVDSNTVSYLDGGGQTADIYHKKSSAAVENMEGAAFGFVCNQLGVKASQVRGVSNFCGKRDEQEWNLKQTFQNLERFFE